MFTRHMIAAAALMAATFAAHADVISTSPDALASSNVIANATVSSASTLASDMSIVDGSTSLSGAGTGLASMLAASNNTAQLYLVRGVEGLYMLASRVGATADAGTGGAAPVAADGNVSTPAVDGPTLADVSLPTLDATDVPEPSSIALMFAGLLGAVGFTRARKQG